MTFKLSHNLLPDIAANKARRGTCSHLLLDQAPIKTDATIGPSAASQKILNNSTSSWVRASISILFMRDFNASIP